MIPDRFVPVFAELAPLATRFADAGHRLYLVGGTVRDLMIDSGREDFDLDLTTDARPPEIKACLAGWADAVWTQGERFGTIGAKFGGPHLRDHHLPRRVLHRRFAQAARHVRRRDRDRPRASRLHGQRDGARADRVVTHRRWSTRTVVPST